MSPEVIEPSQPSAPEVARRACAMHLMQFRVENEIGWLGADEEERAERSEEAADMAGFAEETGFTDTLTAKERELMLKPSGTWAEADLIAMSWRSEGLGVLLWALNAIDSLPSVATAFTGLDTALDPETYPEFIESATLRPLEEIERAHGYLHLMLWRTRTDDTEPSIGEMAAFSDESLIEGDFPVAGQAFRTLDAATRRQVGSTVQARYHALNWLLGEDPDWEAVTTD